MNLLMIEVNKKYNLIYNEDEKIEGVAYDYIVMKKQINDNQKIIFFGDLHSSIHALIDKLLYMKSQGIFNENWILRKDICFICCGDMVDRGPYGIEIIYILFSLFLINDKERFIILNGNHEEENVYKRYGFELEMINQFKDKTDVIQLIKNCMNKLPVAVFIKYKNQTKYIQFCHGGIDKSQIVDDSSKKINLSDMNFENSIISKFLKQEEEESIKYLYKTDDSSISNGFMWSDFIQKGKTDVQNIRPKFNPYDTRKIMNDNNILSVLSGHQDVFELSFTSDKKNSNFVVYNNFINKSFDDYKNLYTLFSINTSDINDITTDTYENETIPLSDICGLMISSSSIPRPIRKSIWCTVHNPLQADYSSKNTCSDISYSTGDTTPVITINWIDTCNTIGKSENNEKRCKIRDRSKLVLHTG